MGIVPLLLYCVADAGLKAAPLRGVADLPVLRIEDSGLAVFFSEADSADVWARQGLRESAVQFHQVLQSLLRTGTILPFRYPSVLADREKLAQHLSECSIPYGRLLERFCNLAQMEALVEAEAAVTPQSGTEYLNRKHRQTQAIDEFVSALEGLTPVKEWRRRRVREGVRCFALLEREKIAAFNESILGLQAPPGVRVRVSGPWPITEFAELTGS